MLDRQNLSFLSRSKDQALLELALTLDFPNSFIYCYCQTNIELG